jgi:hypothetical protein
MNALIVVVINLYTMLKQGAIYALNAGAGAQDMKDRAYFEEKIKKQNFYWNFLEIAVECQIEILEILREIRDKLEHKDG